MASWKVQSFIYICGALSLVVLPKIDAVLAQVSIATLVCLCVGDFISNYFANRALKKKADAEKKPVRTHNFYEKYEYVPPNRVWSRRTKYNRTGAKKCNMDLVHRGYLGQDDSRYASKYHSTEAGEAQPTMKYEELLSVGAKTQMQVLSRKLASEIVPEEGATRLLERLHELEMASDSRRFSDPRWTVNDFDKKNTTPRRMVAGIRDATKALQKGRAQAIVFATDAGADSKVSVLMTDALLKGVPIMVAMSRVQLGKMIVRADISGATVVVILHAEGCEELFEEVTGKKAQERFASGLYDDIEAHHGGQPVIGSSSSVEQEGTN